MRRVEETFGSIGAAFPQTRLTIGSNPRISSAREITRDVLPGLMLVICNPAFGELHPQQSPSPSRDSYRTRYRQLHRSGPAVERRCEHEWRQAGAAKGTRCGIPCTAERRYSSAGGPMAREGDASSRPSSGHARGVVSNVIKMARSSTRSSSFLFRTWP